MRDEENDREVFLIFYLIFTLPFTHSYIVVCDKTTLTKVIKEEQDKMCCMCFPCVVELVKMERRGEDEEEEIESEKEKGEKVIPITNRKI